ncbi:hypothetical protein L198_01283 [Cryptococcus wingfieldii CBS 7118]|uniref:BTB domain-containing protein n=1 Tax=Cryptococcus wingfieldii CBS 7118 TaxID=1295528 RepID=A0A1E3JYS9_9TREE|nr:hypothetical protein L198_01283 [Cryptococcus wingfieldii CBS 7118]ODO06054.1 hypothetical protein L198_01283 [Cryptococcus wingfieldii CBS 7118]
MHRELLDVLRKLRWCKAQKVGPRLPGSGDGRRGNCVVTTFHPAPTRTRGKLGDPSTSDSHTITPTSASAQIKTMTIPNGSSPKEEPTLYGERWKSKEGAGPSEVRLISADNRLLFVPKHLLQSHSTVLCDMLELPSTESPPTITLSDPDLESAAQLTLFLLVVQGQKFDVARYAFPPGPYDGYTVTAYHIFYFLQFAKKYDCPTALRLLESFLYYLTREAFTLPTCSARPLDVFVLAAQADFFKLASLVIQEYQPSLAPDNKPHSLLHRPSPFGTLPTHLPFTLDHIPAEAWKQIPLRYLFALQRSTAVLDGETEKGKTSANKLGSSNQMLRFREYYNSSKHL